MLPACPRTLVRCQPRFATATRFPLSVKAQTASPVITTFTFATTWRMCVVQHAGRGLCCQLLLLLQPGYMRTTWLPKNPNEMSMHNESGAPYCEICTCKTYLIAITRRTKTVPTHLRRYSQWRCSSHKNGKEIHASSKQEKIKIELKDTESLIPIPK